MLVLGPGSVGETTGNWGVVSTHDGQSRLVHPLGRRDPATSRTGEVHEAPGLIGGPGPVRIPSSHSGCKGCDNFGVHCFGEGDKTPPRLVRQHAAESRRRVCRRLLRFREVSGIGPSAAHPHVGRSERGGEFTQLGIGEVDRWPIFVKGRVHP